MWKKLLRTLSVAPPDPILSLFKSGTTIYFVLFSPITRELDKNTGATLFDELIAVTSLLPSRMINGVLLLSGDAELLFNPLLNAN